MRFGKRFLSAFLALLMCLSLIPLAVQAAEEVSAEAVAAEAGPALDGAARPAEPELLSVKNVKSGVKVTWEEVNGADGYIIFRRTGSGDWERIGKVKKGTKVSYIDKAAESGVSYSYTVCAYIGTKKGSYDADGLSILRLSPPVLKNVKNVSTGVKITWKAVTGASKYAVYRKTAGGSWTKIGATKKTAYTDTSVRTGTNYTYTVRATGGGTPSAYDTTGLSIQYVRPWEEAYRSILLQQKDSLVVCLVDLDQDKIPEMILSSYPGSGLFSFIQNIYTFRSGKAVQVSFKGEEMLLSGITIEDTKIEAYSIYKNTSTGAYRIEGGYDLRNGISFNASTLCEVSYNGKTYSSKDVLSVGYSRDMYGENEKTTYYIGDTETSHSSFKSYFSEMHKGWKKVSGSKCITHYYFSPPSNSQITELFAEY